MKPGDGEERVSKIHKHTISLDKLDDCHIAVIDLSD